MRNLSTEVGMTMSSSPWILHLQGNALANHNRPWLALSTERLPRHLRSTICTHTWVPSRNDVSASSITPSPHACSCYVKMQYPPPCISKCITPPYVICQARWQARSPRRQTRSMQRQPRLLRSTTRVRAHTRRLPPARSTSSTGCRRTRGSWQKLPGRACRCGRCCGCVRTARCRRRHHRRFY